MILTPLQKLPKNVEDLSKLIVVNGLKKLPKVKKNCPIWSHWWRWWQQQHYHLTSNIVRHFLFFRLKGENADKVSFLTQPITAALTLCWRRFWVSQQGQRKREQQFFSYSIFGSHSCLFACSRQNVVLCWWWWGLIDSKDLQMKRRLNAADKHYVSTTSTNATKSSLCIKVGLTNVPAYVPRWDKIIVDFQMNQPLETYLKNIL